MVVLRSCRVIDYELQLPVRPARGLGRAVVIILLCRWVFSTGHRDDRTARRLARLRRGRLRPAGADRAARTPEDAAMLRGVLADAGIRCTTGQDPEGRGTEVLVFRADALRARDLVAS